MVPQAPFVPRTHALHLYGSCGPGAQLSLVSKRITFLYEILDISVSFPEGAGHLVDVRLLVSFDPQSFTDRIPPGTSILSMLSPNDYLAGDDILLSLPINLPVLIKGTWLKAHIVNNDAFPHTISALLTLKEMEEPT